ncbi:MAG TPA: PAS domain S-box protein, partial [Leptolinea sp.]
MTDNEQNDQKINKLEPNDDMQNIMDLLVGQNRNDLLVKLLETFPSGITIQTLDGKILYANTIAAQTHGYTLEEFLATGLSRDQLISPGDRDMVRDSEIFLQANK